jgi:hypothetical protein
MKKKLMVAGCSFSAPTKDRDGTSWSELLAKRLGWELVNLARQGCSNGGIRLQMDEIRRQKPDFAIITPTFWDRMEIPADSAPYDWTQAPSRGENPPLEKHLQDRTRGNGYRKEDGIKNVNYGNVPSNMICETIFTLAENFDHPYRMARISKDAQRGIRAWIDSIYDNAWKKQQDEWIITEGVFEMFHDGIPFLLQPVLLWPFDANNQTLWRDSFHQVIPDHYIMQDSFESVLAVCGNNSFTGEDPGYHSSPAGQQIIADNWYRRITKDHGLS